MSSDRFEMDLRARAGRRTRWSWAAWPALTRSTALAGGAIALILVVAAGITSLPRQPGVAASATPSIGPSPSAAASADTNETSGPSGLPPTNAAFDPGPSGRLVVARLAQGAINLVSVDPAGGETNLGLITGLEKLAPDFTLDQDDQILAIGPNGDVLIELRPGNVDATGTTNILARVGEPISASDRVVPSGRGAFTRDGHLVITGSDAQGIGHVYVVDVEQANWVEVAIPSGVTIETRRPTLTSDTSGIFAVSRGAGDILDVIVLGLNGVTRPVIPGEAPFSITGSERLEGADARRSAGGCDSGPTGGGCVLLLAAPGASPGTGQNIGQPANSCCESEAWTPSGRQVLMLSTGPTVWRWNGSTTTKVGTLDKQLDTAGAQIVGFAPTGPSSSEPRWVLVGSSLGTTIQSLDGGTAFTIAGTLLEVVP
jgi:hypothetical protein